MYITNDEIKNGINYLIYVENIDKNEYLIPIDDRMLCLTKLSHGGTNIRIRASIVKLKDGIYKSISESVVTQIRYDLPARNWNMERDITAAAFKFKILLLKNNLMEE